MYTTSCGAKYEIECNSDRVGGDLSGNPYYVNSLQDCIAVCDTKTGCNDVSWVVGSPGPCYLKDTVQPIQQNSNIQGAKQISGCTSPAAASSAAARLMFMKRDSPDSYGPPDFTYVSSVATIHKTVGPTMTT